MMRRFAKSYVPLAAIAAILLFGAVPHSVSASPTTITAYQAQLPVKLDGIVGALEWNDTTMITDSTSGITFAAKDNSTGWMFLMQWPSTSSDCKNSDCFAGIEIASTSNTQAMGSKASPTLMILASQSFTTPGNVDEFISTGFSTPVTVESQGYATQSVCAFNQAGGQNTVECYRPFSLNNASPADLPNLAAGSTIEIGFAVGEFNQPGLHMATQMTSYVLTFSSQTYGTFTTSSTSTTSSSVSTTSTTSSSVSGTNTTSTTSGQSTTTASSASSTTSVQTTSTTHTTTKSTTHTTTSTTTPAGPSVTDYSLELAVIVIGFSLFIVVLTMRYQRS